MVIAGINSAMHELNWMSHAPPTLYNKSLQQFRWWLLPLNTQNGIFRRDFEETKDRQTETCFYTERYTYIHKKQVHGTLYVPCTYFVDEGKG